jgi:hypothetical protein
MSKYDNLRSNPPKFEVVENAREVIINTVSCMCDNKHKLLLKKNEEGDFKLSGCGNSLRNWQFKYDADDIEWAADDNKWEDVFRMINSGTSLIDTVKSR